MTLFWEQQGKLDTVYFEVKKQLPGRSEREVDQPEDEGVGTEVNWSADWRQGADVSWAGD